MLRSPWVIAGIVLLVIGILAWVFIRGSKRLMEWLHEPVEPDKPRWTYALTPLAAALAPLAAFSALLPSYLNQQQSDKKFMAEADRNRTDATWHRIRLDSEAQSSLFTEVQSRFGSPDDKTRAVAALQLADIALLPKPSATGDAFDEENYPHFSATGTQLAVALQMEQNADVRAAYREALRKLITFAAAKGASESQQAITNQLANTNRRAARSFTESLGRYATVNDVTQPSTLRVLATVAPFSLQPDSTMIGLRDLMSSEEFRADRRIGARLRDSLPGEQRRVSDAVLLADVQASALRLIDSRDALADTLRTLRPTEREPAALLTPAGSPVKQALKLQGCFLVGANLWGASLNNADVAGANFGGANLKHTDLMAANMETAFRLPSSITHADRGPSSDSLSALKRKYPAYNWSALENSQPESEAALKK